MKILHVVGARPNFMKFAPVWLAAASEPSLRQVVVHTGQHYDPNMSDVFFRELEIPSPDHQLGVGSGSHAQQTAAIMVAFEPILHRETPDLVLVYGDVNSTLAAALVCAKTNTAVGHVEAGLRSFDRTMPEEVNRVVTDRLASLLFTTSADDDENLAAEGISRDRIFRVGNVMIDSLVRMMPSVERSDILARLALEPRQYAVLTLHRPSNVDDPRILKQLLATLAVLSRELPIIFSVHPRTALRLHMLSIVLPFGHRLKMIEPLGYLDFMSLIAHARAVVTDSGGIQEETSYLGIPCLTLRRNTERPITIHAGTNQLVGTDVAKLSEAFVQVASRKAPLPPASIPLWDGDAARRIVREIKQSV